MGNTRNIQVQEAALQIAGNTFLVQGFSLRLSAGNIPTLSVQLDPSGRTADRTDERMQATIRPVQFVYASLEELTRAPADDRRCAFRFSAQGSEDTQSLFLQDWLLTGVGYVFDRGGAAIGVSVSIRHPAWAITDTPPNLANLASVKIKEARGLSGDDLHALILSCMRKVKELYVDANILRDGADDVAFAEQRDSVENGYQHLVDAFGNHFKWNPRGWADRGLPLAQLDRFAEAAKVSMSRYVTNMFASATWDKLTTSLLADWAATLIPTFWEPTLDISPFAPWAAPGARIPITNFSNVSAPEAAPMPVSAVTVMLTPTGGLSFHRGESQEKLVATAVEVLQDVPGRTITLQTPAWISNLMDTYAGLRAGPDTPRSRGESGGIVLASSALSFSNQDTVGIESMELYDSYTDALRQVWAPQLLLDHHRRQTSVVMYGRLMIQHSGMATADKNLVPGIVMYIGDQDEAPEDPPTDTGLYNFFVTDIVHTVSRMPQATATTQMRGQYVRGPGRPTLEGMHRTDFMLRGVRNPFVYAE